MSNLYTKGNFEPINDAFIRDSYSALQKISDVQAQYNKNDMDTLLNELHDSIVGSYLGFRLVNTEKHGFDCKLDKDRGIYLESKVASLHSRSWSATFNDTTEEKAESFKDDKVFLALSIWDNAAKVCCIAYGQHPDIGEYLLEGVRHHQQGLTVRSTQTISFKKLIFEYKFKILSIYMEPDDLIYHLQMYQRSLRGLTRDKIIRCNEFRSIFD